MLDLTGDDQRPPRSTRSLAAYAKTGGEAVVTLDFSAVDYINSTGIALIVGLLAQARADGQEVQARGLAEHYREIFRDHAALGLHDHPRRRGRRPMTDRKP